MEMKRTGFRKEREREKKLELRKLIALVRDEEYGFDLGKEIYVGTNDVFRNYLKKIS